MAKSTGNPVALVASLLAALLAWGTSVSPASGQAGGAQDRIARIEVQGNEFISREAFLALTDAEVGDPYDEQALRREFWKLWETGLFEDVVIESAEAPGGGRVVIFTVREKSRVDAVFYENNSVIDQDRIEEVLRQNDALITVNAPLDQERVSRTTRLLEEVFASEGHPDARVTPVQRNVADNRVEIEFQIDPGPKVKIAEIEFEGNTVFKDGELLDFLQLTAEKGLFTFMSDKDVFYRPRFEEDLENVRQAYRAEGYLDVRIGEPLLRDARPGKSGKEEKQLVTLVVPIEEGGRYRLGDLRITGNDVFDEEELRRLVPLGEGEVLNDRLLRLGISRIDNKYGDAGYFFAVTSPRYTKDSERLLADVDVQVAENDRYTIRRIDFDGNVRTRDAVLRREMRVQEGDVYSRRDFLVSLRKIAQLGFWELEGEPVIVPAEGEEDELDVTIRGNEVGRNEIQFGGGFSGVDGFFGTFSFQSRNFLGRGSQLSVSGQIGGETTRYSLNYVEPYFMKTRATVGGSIFARDEDFTGFDREGRGATVFWSYPTSTFSAVRLTAAWESSEIVSNTESIDTDEFTTYSLTPSYVFDNRDNPFRPTRGTRLTTALELGASQDEDDELDEIFQQGTINFIKPRAGFTRYWKTTRKQYFGIHAEGGLLEPLSDGGEDTIPPDGIETPYLPVFERYFLGGDRSIRGVETRSVGPRGLRWADLDTDGAVDASVDQLLAELAVGGDQYYLVNLEYSFPFTQVFELTTFIDIGNAYGVSHVNLNDLLDLRTGNLVQVVDSDPFDAKATAGLEVRFHTPVLQQPLRLIYGCKVFGDFFDDEGSCDFQFSIGRTFQ